MIGKRLILVVHRMKMTDEGMALDRSVMMTEGMVLGGMSAMMTDEVRALDGMSATMTDEARALDGMSATMTDEARALDGMIVMLVVENEKLGQHHNSRSL